MRISSSFTESTRDPKHRPVNTSIEFLIAQPLATSRNQLRAEGLSEQEIDEILKPIAEARREMNRVKKRVAHRTICRECEHYRECRDLCMLVNKHIIGMESCTIGKWQLSHK